MIPVKVNFGTEMQIKQLVIKYPDTAVRREGGGKREEGGGGKGGVYDEKFVNGIHFIGYSLCAVTRRRA